MLIVMQDTFNTNYIHNEKNVIITLYTIGVGE